MVVGLALNTDAGSWASRGIEYRKLLIRPLLDAGHSVSFCIGGTNVIKDYVCKLVLNPVVDTVIVGGGDGTVSMAANMVYRSGKPLGVLPLGTFNRFALDIGMPENPIESAYSISKLARTQVDLGKVNDLTFVNNVWLGVYALAIHRRKRLYIRTYRRTVASVIAAVEELLIHRPITITFCAPNGVTWKVTTSLVNISNNSYSTSAPHNMGRSNLNAGTLVIYVSKGTSGFNAAALALESILFGGWDANSLLRRLPGQKVTVTSPRINDFASLDGEPTMLCSPMKFSILQKAMTVLIPCSG